jgi:peptide/nickel transport system permease protein
MIPGIIGIILITFVLSRVLPGDPAVMMAGEQAPPDVVAKIRVELGLDQPLYMQFFDYVKKLFQGDFGTAWHTGHTVLQDFASRLPATIELTLASILIAVLVAIPVGIIAAVKKESILDHISRVI